jgi:hypothetical protein
LQNHKDSPSTQNYQQQQMPRKRRSRPQQVAVAVAQAATDAAVLAFHEVHDCCLQFNRFKAFVDVNDELSSTPHYLTRCNVDAFFDADVQHWDVGPSGKFFLLCIGTQGNHEHVGATENFKVERPITEAALKHNQPTSSPSEVQETLDKTLAMD